MVLWPRHISSSNRYFLLLLPCAAALLTLFYFLHTEPQVRSDIPTQYPPPTRPTTPATSNANILIVSAFFPFAKSKHSLSDYESWLARFLQPITTDMYFYTSTEMEPLVRRCRGSLPITIDTKYASPFDIPPLSGLRDKYNEMHRLDREQERHSPELYAVWNAKPFFLDDALSKLNKTYEYAFWNDAGSFRSEHQYKQWPSPARVEELWKEGAELTKQKPEDLLFFPITGVPHPSLRYWVQDHGPIDNEVSEGSFFGGSPSTISWWRNTFYAYHDYYMNLGLFVGKDQTLINALFVLFPERLISVWLGDPEAPAHAGLVSKVDEGMLGSCGPEWFYYQFWLASLTEQEEMRDLWERNVRWSWDWWRKREKCRVTRLLTMDHVLRRQFGADWAPPMHSVDV
ncbi:hypothetical protein HMN09_01255600 [Mycena chlorophos]|uniref:Uncharacterized protein n=1 Tax=Mycena chlorophos TaxID=658473 RepID=A0A8H6VRZ8_MYCCL|nr:hypothetical protein HMN09_01255600 [Mycena chlorophos]